MQAIASPSASNLNKTDLLAIGAIVAGYAVVLLGMPIERDFAAFDDWAYIRPAEKIASGEGFSPSQYAQATLVTHAYWGALFLKLFGTSITALTAATMCMSLVAAITFYLLLRSVGLTPGLSGLGVALLTLNPYFVNLSYSFMTEITFVALMLLSCLCYVRGLRDMEAGGASWLWLGSVFAAATFLTRQFGVAIPLAAILWLFLARKVSWTRLAAIALLPVMAVALYYAWSSGFGLTYSGSLGREEIVDLVRRPSTWVTRAAHFVYLELFLPGLLVPLFIRLRHWKWAILAALVAGVGVFLLWQTKYSLVARGESSINELSFSWLQPVFPDPTLIYCIGAALTVWLVAGLLERAWPGIMPLLKRQRQPEPVVFLYLVGILLFAGTYIVSLGFLDRYWLPVLPFLITAGLMVFRDAGWGVNKFRLIPAMTMLAIVSLYGFAVHLDTYSSLRMTWQAGRWLVSQGVPYEKMRGGYSWDGYFLHDIAIEKLPSKDVAVIGRVFPPDLVSDPAYVVSEAIQVGYRVVRTYSYTSWLKGLTPQEVYVMQRE